MRRFHPAMSLNHEESRVSARHSPTPRRPISHAALEDDVPNPSFINAYGETTDHPPSCVVEFGPTAQRQSLGGKMMIPWDETFQRKHIGF